MRLDKQVGYIILPDDRNYFNHIIDIVSYSLYDYYGGMSWCDVCWEDWLKWRFGGKQLDHVGETINFTDLLYIVPDTEDPLHEKYKRYRNATIFLEGAKLTDISTVYIDPSDKPYIIFDTSYTNPEQFVLARLVGNGIFGISTNVQIIGENKIRIDLDIGPNGVLPMSMVHSSGYTLELFKREEWYNKYITFCVLLGTYDQGNYINYMFAKYDAWHPVKYCWYFNIFPNYNDTSVPMDYIAANLKDSTIECLNKVCNEKEYILNHGLDHELDEYIKDGLISKHTYDDYFYKVRNRANKLLSESKRIHTSDDDFIKHMFNFYRKKYEFDIEDDWYVEKERLAKVNHLPDSYSNMDLAKVIACMHL